MWKPWISVLVVQQSSIDESHCRSVQLAPDRNGHQVLLVGHAATLWRLQHGLQAWPLAAGGRLGRARRW
jgi:hypothetical protein